MKLGSAGSKVSGMYNLPVNDVMMDGEEEIGAGVQVNFDQAKMYEARQEPDHNAHPVSLVLVFQTCTRCRGSSSSAVRSIT